jgi:putative aldouronate transport system substrate-binding protein
MDTTHGGSGRGISRRALLASASVGLGSLAAGSLLSACSTPSNGGGGTKGAVTEKQLSSVLPKYLPSKASTPDLPGGNGVDPGFTKYPTELSQSVPKTPGAGSVFQSMVGTFTITPPADNSYYRAVNEALGAKLQFQQVPAVAYKDKIAAVLASRKLPDTVTLFAWELPNDINQAASALFADLTPYLAGDAIKSYPNLANIPSSTWMSAVFNGRLHAIPTSGTKFGWCYFYRRDILKKLGLSEPTSAEEWKSVSAELTSPKDNRWATGDPLTMAKQVFGAPEEWGNGPDGGLVRTEETEEFAAALEFSTSLFKAGYVHPDVVAGKLTHKELFAAGRLVMYPDGFGAWSEMLRVNRPTTPELDMQAMPPFAHDGGKAIGYANGGPVFYTVLNKNLPKEKIEEFLRIANYLAAPFGTVERNLLSFGVKGTHYTLDKNGAPTLTAEGTKYAGLTYSVLTGPPVFLYDSQFPEVVTSAYEWEKKMEKVQVTSPVYGLHVQVPPRLAALQQKLNDTVSAIQRGRSPMSELKSAVQQWKSSGGDQLRKLYEDAVAQAGNS